MIRPPKAQHQMDVRTRVGGALSRPSAAHLPLLRVAPFAAIVIALWSPGATAQTLPAGWTAADIGAPTIAGSTQYANGTFTVEGAGVDVWYRSDQFRYVYQAFTGDIEITSRVVSLENTHEWAKAGVMIRETLAANAVQTSLVVTPGQGTNFYRRLTPGDVTQPGLVGAAGAPHWVRLERRGSTVTGFQSSDGVTWTAVGTATMATATMYVGLEVTSHDPGQAATAVFDNVTVRIPSANLPAGWTAADIGAPAIAGSTQYANGTFTVEGAGVDVWDRSDQFRYVYQTFTGDIEITSRVVSLENTHEWAKAGVMIRQTLAANAVQTSLVVTPGQGTNFYRRLTPGDVTQPGLVGPAKAPHWVRLERRGSTVTGYQSSDGVTWTAVGTAAMATATMYVGLEVTSHDPAQAATAVFDNVTVRVPSANQAPTVSLTAPADGAKYTAPATVTVSATAADGDGTLAIVEFYAGTTLIGSDTSSPYSISWGSVPAGTYALTAVARDDDGATTTSAPRTITVNQRPTVSLTSPANGATYTAPATITVGATASDIDGTVVVVEFYAGATLIGSDTTNPYSVTWSDVPAGTYSLTAKARDDDGATRTSAARSITVTGLPAGWTAADIGAPAIAGSTQYANGTFTVEGAGVDVWNTSDEFRYVYQTFTGDIEITSRVVSLENTHEWAKAGVMIRETLAANAVQTSLVVTPGQGTNFYRRLMPGDVTQPGLVGPAAAPHWVRLVRQGSTVTGYQSSDGVTWTAVGTATMATATMYVGLEVTSHDPAQAATAVFDNVTVGVPSANQAPTVSLTAPANGATFTAPATVTVSATASDTDGTITVVEFYRGGTTLVGSDTTSPYSVTWSSAPAGTYSLTAVARDNDGAMTTSAARSITVTAPNQAPTVSLTAPANGATFAAPATITVSATASDTDGTVTVVEFYRGGTTLIGSDTTSPYSITWSNVPAGTYSLTAVARDNDAATTTSAARSITVTGLPAGWTAADIGAPAIAGSTQYANGTFTVEGAGVDVWDRSDEFRYVYQTFTGDIEITSRVVSLENTHEWAKAGVMIRETLAANAVQTSLVVTPGQGTNFYRRPTPGDVTQPGPVGPAAAPHWVRLKRQGSTVTGFQSSDGVTWTAVGTATMATATMYVGLEVTSHDPTQAATAVFDNVTVGVPSANQAPTVSLTAPANGATFTAPATVTVSATASDTDGTITVVEFYRGGTTLVGSDTTSPYSVTWSSAPAGTYSLTAVARDNSGATTTSAARTITVTAPANQPPTVSLTAPANGATFTAPATITLSATASDVDGTVTVVEFYRGGSTLIGSDTTSPYSVTWSNVPAGSYQLTAVARDNASGMTVSSARTITVNAPGTPSRAIFTASADHNSNVDYYVVEIFPQGANPQTANAVAAQNIGKPPVVSGECDADIGAMIQSLSPGSYIATVSAFNSNGSARSAASAPFTR